MNTAQIKAYAPQARRDFIQAVTEKANLFGPTEENIEPAEIKGSSYKTVQVNNFNKLHIISSGSI